MDLQLPAGEALGLLALTVPLIVGGVYSQKRGWDRAALWLVTLLQFLLLTCLLTAVTCIVVMSGQPLVDDQLARLDRRLGVPVPVVLRWMRQHPVIDGLLTLAYHTVIPQTLFTAAAFAWWKHRTELERFILRLMVAALIVLPFLMVFPAVGNFAGYNLEPTAHQSEFRDYFKSLHDGDCTTVSFFVLEGLITFPSYHTAWALILAASFPRRPALLAVMVPLNLLVIVSTLTAGWHYWVDVPGGIIVGLLALTLTALPRRPGTVGSPMRDQAVPSNR